MRMSKLVGTRTKEHPAGCVLDSHALMMRGGYLKGVCAGIYSQFLPLTRVCRKIEDIIREEMDALESRGGMRAWGTRCCGSGTGAGRRWCWA